MARTIKLNKEFYPYLSEGVKNNSALNDVDKTIASYLLYLEQTRLSRGDNEFDYIYPPYDKITENTNVKARQTIVKTINKLVGMGIISRIVKGNVKDGANRYWMNHECINSELTNLNHRVTTIETRSIDNINPSSNAANYEIMAMLNEMMKEIKEIRKENEELRKEISELKLSNNNSDDKPQMVIQTIEQTEEQTAVIETENKTEIISTIPDYALSKYKFEKADDDMLDEIFEALEEDDDITPIEEAPVFRVAESNVQPNEKPKTYEEQMKELEVKYQTLSYIYEGSKLTQLNSLQIEKEIQFRSEFNLPMCGLKERLNELMGAA